MNKRDTNWLLPVGYYIGFVMVGLGALQLIPLLTSLIYQEWPVFFNFMISSSITMIFGGVLVLLCHRFRLRKLGWSEGMVVTAASWFIGMLFCALPYYLSGSHLSYLDACFDVMSGLTTTGLTLIQDLDHQSNGINMWRHLLTFVGGQGMVVLALTFLAKGTSGAYKMYVGEGKDERLAPNVIHTARSIWMISLVYLVIGTLSLGIAGLSAGLTAGRSFLHGLWIFMAAWSTGGFAPMSQNMLYYHSFSYELVTVVFFIIGSFNFALHYAVMMGKRKEIIRNVETISFSITVTILALATTVGLMRQNIYADAMSLFRKGFYQLISGHTTTGFMTIYARQFYFEWGDLAIFAMIVAMLIGGSACSTAGGFKGLRVGMIFQAFRRDVQRLGMPDSIVSVTKIHHIRDTILEDSAIRSAMLIVILYIITFSVATLNGMLCGFGLAESAFEAASVTGNVGLSIGITQPTIPAMLKLTYIIAMWMARLEFMSILALGAFFLTRIGKRLKRKT